MRHLIITVLAACMATSRVGIADGFAFHHSVWPTRTTATSYSTPRFSTHIPRSRRFLPATHDSDEIFNEHDTLERIALRLDGLEVYAIVGTLVSTSSFSALLENHECLESIRFIGAASCLLGLYATVTFLISVVYGRTAVGLNKDAKYLEFMEKTQGHRSRAFLALSISLLLFSIQIVVVLGVPLDGNVDLPLLVSGSLAVIYGIFESNSIYQAANSIFTSQEDEESLSISPSMSVSNYNEDAISAWNQPNGLDRSGRQVYSGDGTTSDSSTD